jgi:hypothetical protein
MLHALVLISPSRSFKFTASILPARRSSVDGWRASSCSNSSADCRPVLSEWRRARARITGLAN